MSSVHKSAIYLLIVVAIWGMAPPIIKHTLIYLPWDLFLTYRFLISIIIMIPWLLLTEKHNYKELIFENWKILLISGLLGSTIQLGLLFWGISKTTSLDGSIINSMAPVFTVIAGVLFLKEQISKINKIGMFLSFMGTLLIIIHPIFSGSPLASGNLWGNILVFWGTISWVIYVILTKQELKEKLSPLFLTTNMFIVGFLSLLPLSIVNSPTSIFQIPLSAHLGVFYMAILSGAIAYWLYQLALKTMPVSKTDIFLYLTPVFTAPLAFYWLKEPITTPFVIGSILIIIGLILSQIKTASQKI